MDTSHKITFAPYPASEAEPALSVAVVLSAKIARSFIQRWSRLSEQNFRVDKWSVCRCCFQKLDSCVPVMQSAQDCMCDDVPDAVDRAPVRRILSERNMRTPSIVIGGEFQKNPPQVLIVEHNQMIGTLAPDRPDQTFNMAVLSGRAE